MRTLALMAGVIVMSASARGDVINIWEHRDPDILRQTVEESRAYDICVAPDGTSYVVGTRKVDSGVGPRSEGIMKKLSSDGFALWTLSFTGFSSSLFETSARAVAIYPTSATGYDVIVAGQIADGTGLDAWIRRYTSSGRVVWQKIFENGFIDGIDDLAVSSGGFIYASGRRANNLDTDLWVQRMAGDGTNSGSISNIDFMMVDDAALSVALAPGGSAVYVAGYVTNGNEGKNIWVGKFPPGLQPGPLWTVTINGGLSSTDYATDVAVDASGDLIVVGTQVGVGTNKDIWVGRISSGGVILMSRTMDGGEGDNDEALSCVVDPVSGDFYVAGYVDRPPSVADVFTDIWIANFSGAGAMQWEHERGDWAANDDEGASIRIDSHGHFLMAGYMTDSQGRKYLYVSKAYYTSRIVPVASNVAHPHAFPNPFRPGSGGKYDSAAITFSSLPAGATVRVYSLQGFLTNELKDFDGDGVIVWDVKNKSGENLASGVYIYVVVATSGARAARGKVVIIR